MNEANSNWKNLYKLSGWVAIILLIYSLATMVILLGLGGPPTTLVTPLYYLLFLSLFIALRKTYKLVATLTLLLGCAVLTLFLAAPSFISWITLSDKFALATNDAQKTLYLAA